MSRYETIKNQFPHLNISILDILNEIDGTESHKYLQLLCKIFKGNLSLENKREDERKNLIRDIENILQKFGMSPSDNSSKDFIKMRILDMFNHQDLELFQEFKSHMENNRIEVTDLTKYSTISDLQNAVSNAHIKVSQKKLEKQIFKEYEDDKWLLIRPLSFESSSVYGSATKWCTTFKREKDYFFKYFSTGSLIYIIDKLTGYKAALFIEIQSSDSYFDDVSFWNSEDSRVDFLSLSVDDYLLPIFKRIKRDRKKNSEFLSKEQLLEVAHDCNSLHRLFNEKKRCEPEPIIEFNIPITENNNTSFLTYGTEEFIANTTIPITDTQGIIANTTIPNMSA